MGLEIEINFLNKLSLTFYLQEGSLPSHSPPPLEDNDALCDMVSVFDEKYILINLQIMI